MSNRLAVINVVGLTTKLLQRMPKLQAWASARTTTEIEEILPAVTCSVQSTYLTGKLPNEHGIVGNGWYFRDECEVKFWRQSNRLVQSPKIWELARIVDPSFTCANLFWWYNMYSSADYSVTPRPMYPADGRKIPDIYTHPATLRSELQMELGSFPLFQFWGPATSIASSSWIAEAAKRIEDKFHPTLNLIYLPHLDYGLQRFGSTNSAVDADLKQTDELCTDLIAFFEKNGVEVLVLSEYGITEVSRPVHLNRVLRQAGLLSVRDELGLEVFDAGASAAFAVADHQVAHVYINDPSRASEVRTLLESTPGVELMLDREAQKRYGLDHPRAGELVAVAAPESWFTYYYWIDNSRAPDYARTVDIHRKPGYDPAELFLDPQLPAAKAKIVFRLLQKKLGFRYLMDVIPLDATLIKGSHGRINTFGDRPILISRSAVQNQVSIPATAVCTAILETLGLARSL